jgi:hypothetical protein
MKTIKILDIGAGPFLGFASDVCRKAPRPVTFASADRCFSEMGRGRRFLLQVKSKEETLRRLEKESCGYFRADGKYEAMPAESETLDMVFLNCWHPYASPGPEFSLELLRVMKKGGIFFWSHPRDPFGNVPGFAKIGGGNFGKFGLLGVPSVNLRKEVSGYPNDLPFLIPPTMTMRGAIFAKREIDKKGFFNDAGYIYRNPSRGALVLRYEVLIKQ